MHQAGSDGELALLLRPILSTMTTGNEPVVVGGLPRLPKDMVWPCQTDGIPTHFFAQIDLSRLTRNHNGRDTPEFPDKGTLYVFLPLGDQGFHTDYKAQVLYTEMQTSELPERTPPDRLNNVFEQDPAYVHPDGMTHNGTVLLRCNVDALPFFSPRISRQNSDLRLLRNEEDRKRGFEEFEAQFNLHRKNIATALRAARPINASASVDVRKKCSVTVLPYRYLEYEDNILRRRLDFNVELLDWRFVYEWAHFFYLRCVNRAHTEINRAETNWFNKWFIPCILRNLDGRKAELERLEYNPDGGSASFI